MIKKKASVEDDVLEKAVDDLDLLGEIYYVKDEKKILKMWRDMIKEISK